MAQLTARLITADSEFDALENSWVSLHNDAQGTIFQTFSWIRLWWKIYSSANTQLRILTIWNTHQLVGVFPVFIEVNNFIIFKFKRMRFMGTYEVYGEYTPLLHPAYETETVQHIAAFCKEEIETKRCDVITFFRFPSTSTAMTSLLQTLSTNRYYMKSDPEAVARVTMNLPGDWTTYLNGLSPTEKELLKRRMRSLEKHGASVEIITELSDHEFDDFVQLHTSAWSDKGISGYFGSKRFEQFQRMITKEFMRQGASRLYFFKKDSIRFAAVHAFYMNKQCCFYLSGLNKHHELIRYSPGKVLLSYVIKDAISKHYEVFDFQGGKEDYKFRLGGKTTGFAKSVIWKKGFHSIIVFMVLALQGMVNFLVGGVWMYHILPRWHKLTSRIWSSRHHHAALASSLLLLPE